MQQRWIVVLVGALALMTTLAAPAPSLAQEMHSADLDALNEIPLCFSGGQGRFDASIRADGTAIDYRLEYSDLSGTVTQAHIHFGKPTDQGGIVVFLCSNLPPPPPGMPTDVPANTPPCPVPSGTVTGTLVASSVINRASAQGISTGDFAKLLVAITFGDGFTYANVHTTVCPGGEIRGQIQ